jgi:hypothetical protein
MRTYEIGLLEIKCKRLIGEFQEAYLALYGELAHAITPYIHLLCHLDEIQSRLSFVLGYYQNTIMLKTVGRIYFFCFFFC